MDVLNIGIFHVKNKNGIEQLDWRVSHNLPLGQQEDVEYNKRPLSFKP